MKLGQSSLPTVGENNTPISRDTSGQGYPRQEGSTSTGTARAASNNYLLPAGYTPFLETVDKDLKASNVTPMRLPSNLTTEDFTRAVAVATVSALRHRESIISHTGSSHPGSAQKRAANASSAGHAVTGGAVLGANGAGGNGHDDGEEGGGHEAPSWTRGVSAGVLLGCTLLYALIAGERCSFLKFRSVLSYPACRVL